MNWIPHLPVWKTVLPPGFSTLPVFPIHIHGGDPIFVTWRKFQRQRFFGGSNKTWRDGCLSKLDISSKSRKTCSNSASNWIFLWGACMQRLKYGLKLRFSWTWSSPVSILRFLLMFNIYIDRQRLAIYKPYEDSIPLHSSNRTNMLRVGEIKSNKFIIRLERRSSTDLSRFGYPIMPHIKTHCMILVKQQIKCRHNRFCMGPWVCYPLCRGIPSKKDVEAPIQVGMSRIMKIWLLTNGVLWQQPAAVAILQ